MKSISNFSKPKNKKNYKLIYKLRKELKKKKNPQNHKF